MKYIDSQLLNGEHIVRVIPISKRAVFIEAGLMFLPFLVLVTVLYVIETGLLGAAYVQQFLFDYSDGKVDITNQQAAIVTGLLFALFVKLVTGKPIIELLLTSLFAIVVVPAFIITKLYGNERALTNMRLIQKTGIIRTEFWDNTIERIQKSIYSQSIMGKLFNYGEVVVTDARGTEHALSLVEKPAEITKLLNAQAGRSSFTKSPLEEVLLPEDPIRHELNDEATAKPQMISDNKPDN
ncbi:MAG: hypothetical protein COB59_06710 [Rhodospirillaceae bacterium]|nr:MAG: hypothetical protein COB59_06710 [Rhodospirillaceae bacterium]